MISMHDIRAAFDILEGACLAIPEHWRAAKTPDARREAERKTAAAFIAVLPDVDGSSFLAAIAEYCRSDRAHYPTPGQILALVRGTIPSGCAAAWEELVARVRRRSGPPLFPENSDDPDGGGRILDVIARRVKNRYHGALPGAPEYIEHLTRLDRPQRADGRWRVAGDELVQTDPQAEAVVWACVEAAGGMWALRSAVAQAADGQAIALDRFRIAFFGAWGRAVASEQGQTPRALTDASRRPA